MCEVMLKYEKIAAEDAAKKERIEAIQNMIDLEISEDKILTKYSKEEYEETKQRVLVEAQCRRTHKSMWYERESVVLELINKVNITVLFHVKCTVTSQLLL